MQPQCSPRAVRSRFDGGVTWTILEKTRIRLPPSRRPLRMRHSSDRKPHWWLLKQIGGKAAPTPAPSEITTLKRRVLAHERILQALIVRLAEDDSDILVQLKATFGSGHDPGEYEQDYVSTDHYGDHFIRSVERAIATLDRQADD